MNFSDWSRIPSRRLAPVATVLAVTAGIAVLAGSSLATGKTVAKPVAKAAQASLQLGHDRADQQRAGLWHLVSRWDFSDGNRC